MNLILYCAKGVYEIPERAVNDINVLLHEQMKGVYLLVDGNETSSLPFVRTSRTDLQATLIYVTSSKPNSINARSMERILESSYQNAHKTFIMNPWTMFELELVYD